MNVLNNIDCSLKCPVFASRSFVVCVWRHWSSDQDDCQRKASHQWNIFPGLTELRRFDRINLDPKIQIKYIEEVSHVTNGIICCVCSILAISVLQDSGEERVTAKSRPMMSLIASAPSTSSASESPGTKSYGNQSPWRHGATRCRRPQTIHWELWLSTLLKVWWWQSLVFSRVESWQNDGWWNGATRCDLLGRNTRVPIKFLSWEDTARLNGATHSDWGKNLMTERGNPWSLKEKQDHSNASLEATKQNWICP